MSFKPGTLVKVRDEIDLTYLFDHNSNITDFTVVSTDVALVISGVGVEKGVLMTYIMTRHGNHGWAITRYLEEVQ